MFFLVKPAYAQCPICIVTVGGGFLIAKKLGIDDLLVSIWISGLNTVIALWLASTIKKKIFNNPLLWSLGFYVLALVYLWFSKQIGHVKNILWGIDKVFLGMTIGLFIILIASIVEKTIKKKNNGKVFFYYQKVIIPVFFLIVATLTFSFVIKHY